MQPPVQPPTHTDPPEAGDRNVSPESGAYAANQRAGMTLFSHSLHDRQPVPVDANEADHRRMLWTRAVGRRDHGSRMAEGRVSIDSDSYVMQIGGDLLHAQAGHDGAVRVGLMAGYGEARADSVSTLIRPDGTVRARARGRTSGYAGGLYGTYHAEEASRLGAYADAWIQFGRYDNRVGSDLGTARYASRVWSASLEGGYAVKPFAPDSALANLVIEPHAQIIHARYRANDATLQDTRMRSGRNRATAAARRRAPVPRLAADKDRGAIRPFVEANWLRRDAAPSVRMDDNTLATAASRNALELAGHGRLRPGARKCRPSSSDSSAAASAAMAACSIFPCLVTGIAGRRAGRALSANTRAPKSPRYPPPRRPGTPPARHAG